MASAVVFGLRSCELPLRGLDGGGILRRPAVLLGVEGASSSLCRLIVSGRLRLRMK